MPQLSQQQKGWDHWYHLIATAYGQWLRGDPRGWRERHQRLHVPGTYKTPPPPSNYSTAIHEQSKRLLKHAPHFFLPEDRPFIAETLLGTFTFQNTSPKIISVGGEHLHALVQCPNDNPQFILGRSKQFTWTKFHEHHSRPWPKLWAKRPYGKLIADRDHFLKTLNYIRNHHTEGAFISEPKETPDSP